MKVEPYRGVWEPENFLFHLNPYRFSRASIRDRASWSGASTRRAVDRRARAGFSVWEGSTVGSYVIYALKQNGLAPAAIINTEAEPIIAVGAIIAGIPMVDRLPPEFSHLSPGTRVTVNGDTGEVSCDETG